MECLSELSARKEQLALEVIKRNAELVDLGLIKKLSIPEWCAVVRPEHERLDTVLREILSQLPELSTEKPVRRDQVYVWGGPTPNWGGSLNPDTLVEGTDFFGAENVFYLHGGNSDEMLQRYRKYQKVVCQVDQTRLHVNPDTPLGNDYEQASELSGKSQRYTNIQGAVIDDMTASKMKPEVLAGIRQRLKAENPALRLYAVVYTNELYESNLIPEYLPSVDVVNLWCWRKDDIVQLDQHIEQCQKVFPGRPIVLGLFMFDYGLSASPTPEFLLQFQLDRAKYYLANEQLEGIVILGDREIVKCPDNAQFLKNWLLREWES